MIGQHHIEESVPDGVQKNDMPRRLDTATKSVESVRTVGGDNGKKG